MKVKNFPLKVQADVIVAASEALPAESYTVKDPVASVNVIELATYLRYLMFVDPVNGKA
jgi:hypothetical protein